MLAEIRSLWIGGALSRLERVCLTSFLRAGHKVYLYTYDEVLNIPEGVEVLEISRNRTLEVHVVVKLCVTNEW